MTLATGRDFLDVSPMRGVIRGGSRHRLRVAVTVEPIELAEPPRSFEGHHEGHHESHHADILACDRALR